MQLNHDTEDSVCSLVIEGDISYDHIPKIRAYLEPLLSGEQIMAVLVDFEKTYYVKPSSIGLIASIYNQCKEHNVKLVLYNSNNNMLELMKATHLNEVIAMAPTKQEALKVL